MSDLLTSKLKLRSYTRLALPSGPSRNFCHRNYSRTVPQGAHSTPDERGAAAAFAVELDDKHGGRPIQMRIVQGKEPPHFMLIFKGTLIIRQGGVKSSFTHVKKVGACFLRRPF